MPERAEGVRESEEMNPMDQRSKFDDEVFTYKVSKDHKVFISWHGKQVTILKGTESKKFLSKIADADFLEAQLIMAKATGNFKRGNERNSKAGNKK